MRETRTKRSREGIRDLVRADDRYFQWSVGVSEWMDGRMKRNENGFCSSSSTIDECCLC